MQPEKTPRGRAEDLISLLVSDWRPTSRQVWWSIRIAIVLGLLFAIGHYYGVTAWDWLQLLNLKPSRSRSGAENPPSVDSGVS